MCTSSTIAVDELEVCMERKILIPVNYIQLYRDSAIRIYQGKGRSEVVKLVKVG